MTRDERDDGSGCAGILFGLLVIAVAAVAYVAVVYVAAWAWAAMRTRL